MSISLQGKIEASYQKQGNSLGFAAKSKEKNEEKDPYLRYPTRALAYTDEIGVALQPALGAKIALGFWVPALAYFGFDIHDKYKKGNEKTALRQAIFHTVASIIAPAGAIYIAQKQTMKRGGENFVKKMYNKLIAPGSETLKKLQKLPFGKKLGELFTKTENVIIPEKSKGFMGFINKIPLIGNEEADEIKELVEMGIKTKGAKNLAIALKTAVGFTTLFLVGMPIDKLTEHFLIKKVVNPALGLKDDEHKQNSFTAKADAPKTENLLTLMNRK